MKTYKITAVAMLSCVAAILQISNGVIGIPSGFGMTVDLVGVPIMLSFLLFGLDAALYTSVITALIITLVAPTSWIGAVMKFTATVPMFLVPAFYLLSIKKNFDLGKILINVFFAFFICMMFFILSINVNVMGQFYVPPTSNVVYTAPTISYLKFTPSPATTSDLILGLLPILTIAVFSLILLHFWGRYSKGISPLIFSSADALFIVGGLGIIIRGIAMIIANYYFAGPLFFNISSANFIAAFPWYIIFAWNVFQGIIELGIAWTLAFRFGFIERYMKW